MNIIKRMTLKIALRILDSSLNVDYKKIDKKAVEEWAFRSFEDVGFKSYLAYEDMKILKELSFGQTTENYYMLIGRRLALLSLFNEMRKSAENKKTRDEKEAARVEKKGGGG